MTRERSHIDEAMERYAAGDDAAFAVVYDEVAPLLLRYLRRRTKDHTIAEDVLQQTLLKVHRHRARFRPGSEVLPWVFTIAIRLLLNRVRTDRRARLVLLEGPEDPEPLDPCVTPEDVVSAMELAERIERELFDLPERQREAFLLYSVQGRPQSDVARSLATTPTAVKMMIHRVQGRLRLAWKA